MSSKNCYGNQAKLKKKIAEGITHAVEQLLFSLFPSIPTFYLNLILWLVVFFLLFWALMGYFWGQGRVINYLVINYIVGTHHVDL